ncbi:hypothetical protein FHR81_003098 [Actinoalloteichus hoggarensis]|uniref:Uncharacterized protein n=1 Tax=Actinoalloteichus hoggarensis TaxID=1470176 RepID=A0A221W7U2_9PSEU|nr:hypothetical protein [Actinoalloteichus hoggarensis]ASO21457.1 hypothetical protein AHOG_19175 [Actinoalloteichus hoggarensis]MBB5922046.1 hypothetical protein [Actinoalloteichus hoggarensis]
MNRRIGGPGGGSDKGSRMSGVVTAACVMALGTAAAGGVTLGGGGGAVLSGTGTLGGTGVTGGSGSSGGSSLSGSLRVRTNQAKGSARRGDAGDAWKRLGTRVRRQAARRESDCVGAAFGQVRTFLLHTPCRSLDRMLFALDGVGGTILVSVAWVEFSERGSAREFTGVIDVHGSGDIRPLGAGLLDMADVSFSADHYRSRSLGTTVTIAETEAVGGRVDAALLQAAADVAAELPRP